MTHPAKAERLRKEKNPDAFCKNPACLWRRSSGTCPKHERESLEALLEASIERVKQQKESA